MKKDIILSGVGGQGILSIATVIGQAALKNGLYMKQAEVHGMSQRGGDVQSNLRISDQPIASDLIPTGKCDLIISLEPMEALRYLPYLNHEGWLVTNEVPFINIPHYPTEKDIKEAMSGSFFSFHTTELLPRCLPTSRSFCGWGLGGRALFQKAPSPDIFTSFKTRFHTAAGQRRRSSCGGW